MRLRTLSAALLAFCTVTAYSGAAQELSPEQTEVILRDVQRSHIEGNVPPPGDFDRLLARDLAAYFALPGQPEPRVEYELLRDGPTQSGVSYPKYYVWLKVVADGRVTREGAARIAAVERNRFEVTHFVESSEVGRDPSQLEMLFPPAVADRIRAKLEGGHP